MIEGLFVFDSVIHMYDLSDNNLRKGDAEAEKASREYRAWFKRYTTLDPDWTGMLNRMNGTNDVAIEQELAIDTMFDMVFRLSPTDLAIAQTVPLFDHFPKGFSPNDRNHALAQKYPDRVLFCAGVDPVQNGLDATLREMEYCVKELGAKSFKFYNGNLDHSWRCDDPDIAYPMYRKAAELGITLVQFHKGFVLGRQPHNSMNPLDIEQSAKDFPEINFMIHHAGLPHFFDEAISLAMRFDNIYLALSGITNMQVFAPRRVQEIMGRLLQEIGTQQLCWGSEAAIVGLPGPYLQAFVDMEIPEDLRRGYGYPQITREDKRQILSGTLGKLYGIDIEAKTKELAKTPVYEPERAAKVMESFAARVGA